MKERILEIMKLEGMSPSGFAEEIGIDRGRMSHITNGRNNPSIEVFGKILDRFTYINPDWLLSGKGNREREAKPAASQVLKPDFFDSPSPIQTEKKNMPEYHRETKDKKEKYTPKKEENETVIYTEAPIKKVVRIIIYYSDTTYEILTPEK